MLALLSGFSVIRVLGVSILVGILASGGAYMWGRSDGRALERAEAMAAAEQVRKTDEFARAQQAAENLAEIEKGIERDAGNDEIETDLLRPSDGDDAPGLDGGFLRDLKRLQ